MEATVASARRRVAALLRCDPTSVAFTYSASDALGLLTQSIPWNVGDRVVVSQIEYPSDLLVWRGLDGTRLHLDVVDEDAFTWSTQAIAEKIGPRTRLVVVSAVSFCTGHRAALQQLKEAVNRQGGWLLVDATQALGAVPLFADEADMIVASGFKWMMGVHGVAVLYCSPKIVDQLVPPFLGWRSVHRQEDAMLASPMKAGAERFEMGMPGFPAIYGLEAGLAYLQDQVGIERVWQRVADLSTTLWDGLHDLGVRLITRPSSQERAGIVCMHHPRAREIVASLQARGVYAYAPVSGVVRFSPHFFNTESDITACLDALKDVLSDVGGRTE